MRIKSGNVVFRFIDIYPDIFFYSLLQYIIQIKWWSHSQLFQGKESREVRIRLILNVNIQWYICNGGGGGAFFSSYISFFHHNFPLRNTTFYRYIFGRIWSLTVCSESHKSAMVACVLVRWHSWTWLVYVVGPIWLVSWPAWRASSGAVSPQTQARRACQLNRKHSRFRGRICCHNAGVLWTAINTVVYVCLG